MKLQQLMPAIRGQILTGTPDAEVSGCYISDLLSDVLAHAQPGVLWVTIQTHRNVVTCAATKDISVVLITNGRKPTEDVIMEAEENNIVIVSTPLSTYEAAARIWETGLR